MYKSLATLFVVMLMTACESSIYDQTEQSIGSTTTNQQQSQIKVNFNGVSYDFVVHGRCAGGPHYNFWGLKPEFINTTGRGPRIHLIGGPEETVIKFYQDDQQRLNQVLTGMDAVPYQNGKMHINVEGKDSIDILVNCQQ